MLLSDQSSLALVCCILLYIAQSSSTDISLIVSLEHGNFICTCHDQVSLRPRLSPRLSFRHPSSFRCWDEIHRLVCDRLLYKRQSVGLCGHYCIFLITRDIGCIIIYTVLFESLFVSPTTERSAKFQLQSSFCLQFGHPSNSYLQQFRNDVEERQPDRCPVLGLIVNVAVEGLQLSRISVGSAQ